MPSYYCEDHQTNWFKKGAMKAYAHPIKDSNGVTSGWCNMPKEEVPAVVKEIEKEGGKLEEVKTKDSKNKAFALSYSKDIGVALINAGKECSSKKIIEIAKEICLYLDGD